MRFGIYTIMQAIKNVTSLHKYTFLPGALLLVHIELNEGSGQGLGNDLH